MLAKIRELIDGFNRNGVRYCHWKSNFVLTKTIAGETDIDLLVERSDALSFRRLMAELGFHPAASMDGKNFPSVEHYYALDGASGVLAHVHVYFRVMTGESLAKNYHLPVETMLLENTRELECVRVPTQGAELVTFTVRMMLKHTALVELLLLARGKTRSQLQEEASWLSRPGSPSASPLADSVELARRFLPAVDAALFSDCLKALTTPTSLLRRILLGRRLRRQLRPYARHPAWRVRLTGVSTFLSLMSHRLLGARRDKALVSGGAVVAFVGPEASGKSTLLAELDHWLDEDLSVARFHAGKPPSTWLTALPNLLVPTLRSLLPASRSTRIEAERATPEQRENAPPGYPLLFAVRSVLLAYDRRSLLLRAFRLAANGTIVLCDRYPSLASGAPDGPQLPHLPLPPGGSRSRRLLARLEARLYGDIPPPDLVVQLSVPLEVAVLRNATRGKREPEDHVRRRHSMIANIDFGRTPVRRIDTDRPVAETLLEVKRALWSVL